MEALIRLQEGFTEASTRLHRDFNHASPWLQKSSPRLQSGLTEASIRLHLGFNQASRRLQRAWLLPSRWVITGDVCGRPSCLPSARLLGEEPKGEAEPQLWGGRRRLHHIYTYIYIHYIYSHGLPVVPWERRTAVKEYILGLLRLHSEHVAL